MKKKLGLIVLLVILTICLFACGDKTIEKVSDISYFITISGEDNVFKCNQTTTINNTYCDGLEILVFNLYANAYSEKAINKAYTEKLTSYGGIKINSVTIDGTKCNYTLEQDNSFLNVAIPSLDLDKSLSVEMSYTLTLPECNLRMGVINDCTKLTNFYPQLAVYKDGDFRRDVYSTTGDPFFSETADYEVLLTVPSDSVIASSGSLVNETITSNGKEMKFTAQNIRDFAIVIDKNLLTASANVGNTEVIYYYYEDENSQTTLKYATDALTVFNEKYGVYPFDTLSVVMTGFECAGMEFGRLVYIALDTPDIENTIVHEIAHQWWYGLVGNDSINEAYLDEGLTTFSTLYYYKQTYGQEKYNQCLKEISNSYVLYERIQNMRKTGADLSITRSIYDFTDYQYDMLVYKKSAMMFAHLLETMGEEKFNKALQCYVKDNSYNIVSAQTLVAEFSKTYGSNIEGLVNGWLGNQIRSTMISA
ncbi:MAG TPA: M1 family metallopeptidase [Clostridia bacterium]|nr:M1 family metallopeptidase [Clostridia bacterium]